MFRILDALLVSFSQALDTPQEVDELGYCRAVVLATQEPECIQVRCQLAKLAAKQRRVIIM